MRKKVVISCLTMALILPLYAQFDFGGLISFNLSSFSVNQGPNSEDYSSKLGFGVGAVVDWPLTGQFDLHAEPMFLQKGGKIETSSFVGKLKVNYLEIPLMIRYTYEYSSSLLPYAMAGPSVGLLSSARFIVKNEGEQDEKENTKGLDFGVGIGGGIKIPKGNNTFFAETRYVLGLANINKEADESEVKNRGLQVLVGITVPVGQN